METTKDRARQLQKLDSIRKVLRRVQVQARFAGPSNYCSVGSRVGGVFKPFDDETLEKKVEHFREQNYLWMVRLGEVVGEGVNALKALE